MQSTDSQLNQSVARSSQRRSTPRRVVSKRNEGLRNCRETGCMFLDIDRIDIDEGQVRQIGREEIEGLDESIEKIGVLQPIKVRWNEDTERYVVVVGERRFRAAREAGKLEIPITFGDATDANAVEVQLAENNLKKPMHAIDTINAVRTLLDAGRSQVDITKTTGISAPVVSKAKKISELPSATIKLATSIPDLSVNRLYKVVSLNPDEQLETLRVLSSGDKEVFERKTSKNKKRKAIKRQHSFTASNGFAITIRSPKGKSLVMMGDEVDVAIEEFQEWRSSGCEKAA